MTDPIGRVRYQPRKYHETQSSLLRRITYGSRRRPPGGDEIVHETDDMPVFDRCQQGIRSPFYDQGRLSVPYERCIWEFNLWWTEQLGDRILK